MTRLEALIYLRDTVKAGDDVGVFSDESIEAWDIACPDQQTDKMKSDGVCAFYRSCNACRGSTDAALKLRDALLPDFLVHDLSETKAGWFAVLNGDTPPYFFHGKADTPARALLLAILEALIAKEQDT